MNRECSTLHAKKIHLAAMIAFALEAFQYLNVRGLSSEPMPLQDTRRQIEEPLQVGAVPRFGQFVLQLRSISGGSIDNHICQDFSLPQERNHRL